MDFEADFDTVFAWTWVEHEQYVIFYVTYCLRKKGYKKLAAYETSENGFEWYGATPPHEALSAYGLMEFTEMKEVYNGVDGKMLQRTVNWLLSRRNGKGGFKQKRGKYGFSAAPENVNNAYIVYALAASGIKTDIEKEFNSTYQEAIKNEDIYRMALVALASHHLNKTNEFNYNKMNLLAQIVLQTKAKQEVGFSDQIVGTQNGIKTGIVSTQFYKEILHVKLGLITCDRTFSKPY